MSAKRRNYQFHADTPGGALQIRHLVRAAERAGRWRRAIFVSWLAAAFVGILACGSQSVAAEIPEEFTRIAAPGRQVVATSTASVIIKPDSGRRSELVTTLVFIPEDVQLRPNETQRISVAGFGADGAQIEDLTFNWSLADALAGSFDTITDDGSALLFKAGNIVESFPSGLRVTAVQDSVGLNYELDRSIDIEVNPVEEEITLASVESIFGEILVVQGQFARLNGAAYDAIGRPISRALVEWQISDPELGQITANLLAVTAEPGVYPDVLTVRATFRDDTIEAPVTLRVQSGIVASEILRASILPARVFLRPNEEFQFRQIVVDGNGSPVKATGVRWRTTNPAVGTVDDQGLFRGTDTPGIYSDSLEFSAQVNGETMTALASIVIRDDVPIELANVAVRPSTLFVLGGQDVKFRLLAQDEKGRSPSDVTLSWEVTDSDAGSIDDVGLFTASNIPGHYSGAVRGTATQTVEDGVRSLEAVADITIVGELARLTVNPSVREVAAGGVTFFRASAVDENGVRVPGVIIEWTLSDPAAGTIGNSGVLQAADNLGEYQVHAKGRQILND